MKKKQLCNLMMMILLFSTGHVISAPAIGDKLSDAQKLEVIQSIERYQQDIGRLESDQGFYGAALTEKLSSLGIAYQYADQHNKAIKAFKRAVHLNRVNDGLYTQGQIPMIQRLIASHMALGQWEEVSARYNYLYWLSNQNYGKNDPRMLPTLSQLSKWHLQAYGMQFGKDREAVTNHLITAHTFFERSINLLDQSAVTAQTEQQLIEELNGLTLTSYLFATFQRVLVPRNNVGMALDPDIRHSAMLIDHYISRSFRSGKEAIGRVIDIYNNSETAPAWAVPTAKVKMADWLFIFNKRTAAFALYQEAYHSMNDSQSQKQLDAVFGYPVALPNLAMFDAGPDADNEQHNNASDKFVLASFDVTPQGSAANIEIIDSNPLDNISARTQVKRSLRITKFRPRFIRGQPTLTEKMKLRVLSN